MAYSLGAGTKATANRRQTITTTDAVEMENFFIRRPKSFTQPSAPEY